MGRKSSQLDCFTAKCLFQSLPEKSSGHCHFPSHRSSPAVFCPHRRRCKSALPCTRCHQTRLRQLGPQQRSCRKLPLSWTHTVVGSGSLRDLGMFKFWQSWRSYLSAIKQLTLTFDAEFLFNYIFQLKGNDWAWDFVLNSEIYSVGIKPSPWLSWINVPLLYLITHWGVKKKLRSLQCKAFYVDNFHSFLPLFSPLQNPQPCSNPPCGPAAAPTFAW